MTIFKNLHDLLSNLAPNSYQVISMKGSDIQSSEEVLQRTHVTEVKLLTQDARKVVVDSVFVAIPGNQHDGHDFIQQAFENGANAIVFSNLPKFIEQYQKTLEASQNLSDEAFTKIKNCVAIYVADARAALDELASGYYDHPSEKLFCVGVTGTNGKTSMTYMIEHLLNSANMHVGVIGTIDHHLKDKVWPSAMTTPDPIHLQERIAEMLTSGADALAMEISSHALDQKRAESVAFDVAVFSNLTRDHLDYHKTMEAYFEAKSKLFSHLLDQSTKSPLYAVVNTMSSWGRKIRIPDRVHLLSYGQEDADLEYKIEKIDFSGTDFKLKTPQGEFHLSLPMIGEHNVQNMCAAIGVAIAKGLKVEDLVQSVARFKGVPGRLQKVIVESPSSRANVFIDYAHTPDALENVLVSLQAVKSLVGVHANSPKIWTVFGCGGDRDKGKRPQMAQIAEKLSDFVIVTSDNPRTENPQSILNEIQSGFVGKKYLVEPDRSQAIAMAIEKALSGDVVLIAGKGHEDYQIIGTEKIRFSDYEEAEKYLLKKYKA
jgi:UDP-N-acetylmuramoyl-L-alanyl-D-glutamate--2,6-diaminopimelate ligase